MPAANTDRDVDLLLLGGSMQFQRGSNGPFGIIFVQLGNAKDELEAITADKFELRTVLGRNRFGQG